MNEQEASGPVWTGEPVGLGDTPTPAPTAIVQSPPATAVAPVVVVPKQGVSFSAMILIAAGAALIGGVVVWLFAGQPELRGAHETAAEENPVRRKKKVHRKKIRK